jgi:hypothetical protein
MTRVAYFALTPGKRGLSPFLALEGDRAGGAVLDGLFDFGAEVFGGLILEDGEEAFVVYFEDFGGFAHANRVSLAEVEVDFDFHHVSSQ